jgi:hypothetical protein
MKIGGYVAFALEDAPEFDPDGCEVELRRVGFEVTRLPDRYRSRLAIPTDDFLLVMTECSDDDRIISAVWDQINFVADRYAASLRMRIHQSGHHPVRGSVRIRAIPLRGDMSRRNVNPQSICTGNPLPSDAALLGYRRCRDAGPSNWPLPASWRCILRDEP